MRKITLCLGLLAMTFGNAQEFTVANQTNSSTQNFENSSAYAQQTLSHSISQDSNGSGVACRSNPDEVPGTGDEGISDNIFYRAYTPEDFDFSGDFQAIGISFVAVFFDVGGTNPTVTNTVRLYTSSDVFPAGTLTEIASKEFEVTAADDGNLFEVIFDEEVVVDASSELIVAVDIAPSPAVPDNYDFDIGRNDAGQNDPSYLSSSSCGLTAPGTFASIGFPDEHIILNLIGDSFLNTNTFDLSKISVFPNPAQDVLNLELPSNIELNSATLYDLTGRDTGVNINNKTMNISDLSSGVYLLKVETNGGTLSRKIIKK